MPTDETNPTPESATAAPARSHVAMPPNPMPAQVPLETFTRERDELQRERAERAKLDAEIKAMRALMEEQKATAAKLTEQFGVSEAEKKRIAEERRADKIRYEARMAAVEHGAVDPDELVSLLASSLTLDDAGNVITSDATKASVKDHVKAYLEKKPHHAKARASTGSGSSPFTAQTPSVEAQKNYSNDGQGLTDALRDRLRSRLSVVQPTPSQPSVAGRSR